MKISKLAMAYKLCKSTGCIKEKSVDVEFIYSLKFVAEKGLNFINSKLQYISKDGLEWTFVFRDYYESLRGLIEAYMLLDGFVADNHQCKNSYICFKHPTLLLDWEFLETIRLKRNAVNYRGLTLNFNDWLKLKSSFERHINILKTELTRKLRR